VTALRSLSARQARILRLYANGRTTAQVAAAIGRSEDTVRRDMTAAMAELGAGTRAQAVAVAMRVGLVRPGDVAVPPRKAARR
jgi:DNA-binding CsgD family transcriptional regulator